MKTIAFLSYVGPATRTVAGHQFDPPEEGQEPQEVKVSLSLAGMLSHPDCHAEGWRVRLQEGGPGSAPAKKEKKETAAQAKGGK